MHILFCLGSGSTYNPYKSHPSNLQLLRARQGFKEKIRTVQMALMRGVIDYQSVALICSAALFEELTSGWAAGIEVLDQAFALVLPGIFPVHLLTSCRVSILYDSSILLHPVGHILSSSTLQKGCLLNSLLFM